MKTLPYARKQEILEMLKENEFVDVDQLSKKFEVSYMTINRDLKELEESGAVSRVYGAGAVYVDIERGYIPKRRKKRHFRRSRRRKTLL